MDERPPQQFEYIEMPLPSAETHIRLLKIQPSRLTVKGSGSDEDHFSSRIVCEMTTTDIRNPAPYKCLSYRWGPDDRNHWVEVAGTWLPITESLDTAIRHLRPKEEALTIWIDQICVNQGDGVEKGHQVVLMKDVYSKAEQTLTWLGPAADGSDELMDCWADIGGTAQRLGLDSYFTKERLPLLYTKVRNEDPDDELTREIQKLLERSRPIFDSVLEAMVAWDKRPWFSRVWVVQEVALCANAMFVEHDSQATLARDRIYGMLGIAVDTDQLGIVPDYTSKSSVPALRDAARSMIRNGRVELLSFSQFPKEAGRPGLPTWAPDWRPGLSRSFYTVFEYAEDHLLAAAGTTSVDLLPTSDPNVLGLGGYLVDTIEATGTTWQADGDYWSYFLLLKEIKALCETSAAKNQPIYADDARRAEAHWRVPVGDLFWTAETDSMRAHSPAVRDAYDDCMAVLEYILEWQSLTPEQLESHDAEFPRRRQPASRYRSNMGAMTGKKTFLTQKGYVGMGPSDAAMGDAVVVLCGGRIPHVLRPLKDGDRYTYVGEAYCDGVMDGEILSLKEKEYFYII
ncbi:HET-domain-containing protein [Sodiomyces alkalinus F11]|uniref:HET-domain-containing protein n=1 Tax=Sodiomyces alkalinus (strain CBS 110278 / VKM F-3762 / F11) TaxID=1314773 RepID=A0A3N2Q120_SODAK|nr:HET-domain-containing protein [Sodiomyces alkalinus F11]ROT40457.1 HET-domain-containing protein [Sodiomyces alkalinus F11]